MPLIDLHTDWLLQYAPESTLFDAKLYDGVAARWPQSVAYLQTTSAAILSCYRRGADWASQSDPWLALEALITRIEAEFPGRILRDPIDFHRWRDSNDGLCWAMIGIEGFDALVRDESDLPRLADIVRRGVRLFQPSYTAEGKLAGSSAAGDDRGLTDLGRRFLETLGELASSLNGPKLLIDLAHLNPRACGDVLRWFESGIEPTRFLVPIYSHGMPAHLDFWSPRAITWENLTRLRALGGIIGFGVSPPFLTNPAQLKACIEGTAKLPFLGNPGFEGIAIGTDFLGVDTVLPELATAEGVVDWVRGQFDEATAHQILFENARKLLSLVLTGQNRAV